MPNLLTDTEELNLWTASNVTVTQNTTAGPADVGGTTADTITESATTAQHNVTKATAASLSGTYTVSVYVKAAARDFSLSALVGGGGAYTYFNNDGSFSYSGTFGTGVTLVNQGSVNAGGGWWRLWVAVSVSPASAITLYLALGSAGTDNYLGNGTSAIIAVGGQVNAGSTPTTYERVPLAAVTGTGAVTIAGPTLASNGTRTVPSYTGTGAVAIAGAAVAGTGTATPPAVSGLGAVAIAGPAVSGAGTVATAGSVAGTGAVVVTGPAIAGTGTVALPAIAGTAAVVIAGPAVAAAGTNTVPGITGTGAVAIAGPTVAGTDAAPVSPGLVDGSYGGTYSTPRRRRAERTREAELLWRQRALREALERAYDAAHGEAPPPPVAAVVRQAEATLARPDPAPQTDLGPRLALLARLEARLEQVLAEVMDTEARRRADEDDDEDVLMLMVD